MISKISAREKRPLESYNEYGQTFSFLGQLQIYQTCRLPFIT